MNIRADLHVHTYYSDGTQSPADAVQAASAASLGILAVTDHDTLNACAETEKLCRAAKINFVSGIEISAYSSVKVHVLGYGIDRNSKKFKAFEDDLRRGAETRGRDILGKLQSLGINISEAEVVRERFSDNSPVHTFYIARAAVRKGYAQSPYKFYADYLAVGSPAYSSLCRPSPERAVEVVKESGGVCSLAHPARITLAPEELLRLIDSLISCGLDGIEAVYSGHTNDDTAYYKEIARAKNLLITGGSDTHTAGGSRAVGTPEFYPDERLLCALKLI